MDNQKAVEKRQERRKKDWKIVGLSGLVLGAFVFNYYFEISFRHRAMVAGMRLGDRQLSREEQHAAMTYLKFREIKQTAIPFGIPPVYGQELGVSFDRVQESMDKMRVMGPTYGVEGQKIVLAGDDLQRFIAIGQRTACEYCCGVQTLVNGDGGAACGCAHSIVMRGLAAYLMQNHGAEYTDDEILTEINNWKKTFFPKQTLTAKFDELRRSGDKDIEALLQEFPDFLPQMVGGC